jgi:competence protein ComEC
MVDLDAGKGAPIRLLATRSSLRLPWQQLIDACAAADMVVADRTLPQGCTPRWLKLDRRTLAGMGGALILLDPRRAVAGRDPDDRHPWVTVPRARQVYTAPSANEKGGRSRPVLKP